METHENNKLIAEFMGLKPVETFGRYSISLNHCTCREDTPEKALEGFGSVAKYHESFDWLMPVVEKCVTTSKPYEWDSHEKMTDILHDALWTLNIVEVHKAVVDFITWYNENK